MNDIERELRDLACELESSDGLRAGRTREVAAWIRVLAGKAGSAPRPSAPPDGADGRVLAMWPRFEDGAPVAVGDAVGLGPGPATVTAVSFGGGAPMVECKGGDGGEWSVEVHGRLPRPDVLDADGEPIREGDVLWDVRTGERRVVERVYPGGVFRLEGSDCSIDCPGRFSHAEPDHWAIWEGLMLGLADKYDLGHVDDRIPGEIGGLAARALELAGVR